MRRVVAWNVMTLDGYFEGARPWDLDMHGTVWGDELQAFSLSQGEEIGTLLFGRRTYEGTLAVEAAVYRPRVTFDSCTKLDEKSAKRH